MSWIAELVRFLTDPFNILWLLGLGMILLWVLDKKERVKKLAMVTVLFFLIVSTPLFPVLLVNSLEDRYLPLDAERFQAEEGKGIHILVLGGGHGYDDRLPANTLLSSNALGRLNEGLRLHHQIPGSTLVLSGSTSTPGRLTQAEMLKEAALLLGVDEDSIILQKEPANTCQEAQKYAEVFKNRNHVIMVTSAMHMPRAERLFMDFGIDVIPSATNYRLKGSWKSKRLGLPSLDNMSHTSSVITSYVAMAEARFRSRFFGGCR
jgi:uncharacterized SAM-binding protein YcdF (DUF218 family)